MKNSVLRTDKKLAELISTFSRKCEMIHFLARRNFNKLLFYSDFNFYRRWGKSITGQEYQRLDQGPCPRRLLPVRNALVRDRAIAIRKECIEEYTQQRSLGLRDADLSIFSGLEIALIDEVIERYRGKTASFLSDHRIGLPDGSSRKMGTRIPTKSRWLWCLNDDSSKNLTDRRWRPWSKMPGTTWLKTLADVVHDHLFTTQLDTLKLSFDRAEEFIRGSSGCCHATRVTANDADRRISGRCGPRC